MFNRKRIGAVAGVLALAAASWTALPAAPAGATGTITYVTVPAGINGFYSVSCASSTTCVAVGWQSGFTGAIARTTNGGLTWSALATPGGSLLKSVACPTASECVAVGDNGAAIYSNNGGQTWVAATASPGVTIYLSGVACPSASVCFAVGIDVSGAEGIVYSSSDGGAAWTDTGEVAPGQLFNISCATTTHCVAVGNEATIVTTDGGAHWSAQTPADFLQAVDCFDATHCVAGGYDSGAVTPLTRVSTNGGSSWTDHALGATQGSVYGIACPRVDRCAASGVDISGNGVMLTTTDGGATWDPLAVNANDSPLTDTTCPSVSQCITVGYTGSGFGTGVIMEFDLADAISITPPGNRSGVAGHAIAPLAIHATDSSNAATKTFSATGLPSGLTIDHATGVIHGTPQAACTCAVTVRVTDNIGGDASTAFTWTITAVTSGGYRLGAGDGGVFAFGTARFVGSAAPVAGAPIVAITATTDGNGYWLAASDGTVHGFGDAHSFGNAPTGGIVGFAPTPSGNGYWLVSSTGGVFAFGDAHFFGSGASIGLTSIVGLTPTPDGRGYWLVSSDGGVFAFGDAHWFGSAAAIALRDPVVGIRPTRDGRGYWLVAADGGVFAFGDARFMGSAAPISVGAPIVGMVATGDDRGYWVAAADGGVFCFGDAGFDGSTASTRLVAPVIGIS